MRRLITVLAVTALLGGASACTSDGPGGGSSPSVAASGGAAAELTQRLHEGQGSLRSASFTVAGTLAGQSFTGSGVQRLTGGVLRALRADVRASGLGVIGIVVSGEQRYAKLPAPFGNATKPWIAVTSGSQNIVVKQVGVLLDAALAVGSLATLSALPDAATSVRRTGTTDVGGVATTRYALQVDPAKLPGSLPAAGVTAKQVPVELWVDAGNRPVRAHVALSLGGQQADVTITFSDFGEPVTVTVPPASQVSTG